MNELRPDTLKQWELGVNQVNIAWIPAICKVPNCDTGYLFGEHEEKIYLTCDIPEKIGLEESAIAKLTHLKKLDSYYKPYNGIAERRIIMPQKADRADKRTGTEIL